MYLEHNLIDAFDVMNLGFQIARGPIYLFTQYRHFIDIIIDEFTCTMFLWSECKQLTHSIGYEKILADVRMNPRDAPFTKASEYHQ